MLKKLILAAAVCVPAFGGLDAAIVQKSPSDVKIYINPGHGGFNSNCRPMGTVKRGANVTTSSTAEDTTAFFESNTNLWKCLAMYHKLLDYGVPGNETNALYDSSKNQHIVMSRITNGADTDRGLSTDIAVEVEKFAPDIFISVHSNASPDGTIGSSENYPLVIYRGEDYRSTTFTDTSYGENWDYAGDGLLNDGGSSYELGKLVYSHLATIEHEPYTDEWSDQYVTYSGYTPLKTEHNVRGDVSLRDYFDYLNDGSFTFNSNRGSGTTNSHSGNKYYGYYGVMKHGAVGVLSEGYMHSYYPSVNRHMNKDVCAIEGISYAHAIADYFGWEKEETGYIYGIVRDRNQTFSHTYYIANPNSDDIYKPLNNCTVKLYKDGELVKTYTTDDEWNGAFVFYDLEPGDYTLDYECDGYQPASEGLKSTVVTVKANEITYPKAFLNATGYSMNASETLTESWRQVAGDTYGDGFWIQGAATTDESGYETVYTLPAIQDLTNTNGDFFVDPTNYKYTKGFSYREGHSRWFSGGSTSAAFPQGSGTYYEMGPAIAADNAGTLWMPTIKASTAFAWADAIKAVAYYTVRPGYRTDYVQDTPGTKSGIDLSSCSIGRADLMSAYGDGINDTGYLWFCDNTNDKVVAVKLTSASIAKTYKFSPPSGSMGSNRSLAVQYSDTEVMYNCGRDDASSNGTTIYKGVIDWDNESITWTDLNLTTYRYTGDAGSAGATMFRMAGNEYVAYSSSSTEISVKNITTGNTITVAPNMTSKSGYVNHSINARANGDNMDLYVYLPGSTGGVVKYVLSPAVNVSDSISVTTVAKSEATVTSKYEQDITVTWEKPDTWDEDPTNYLVQYRMSFTHTDGNVYYLNPAGQYCTESDWNTAGMTGDATCSFVHEGVQFAHDGDSTIFPLTYTYRIIPNFNCYDGEASAITSGVTVDIALPQPSPDDFAITAQCEDNELKQYDGAITWTGVDVTSNNQWTHAGYSFKLYSSKDQGATAIKSFTFNTDDTKYFGTIDSETGEGAILDAEGNAIENLTYSVTDGVYTFKYNAADLDVLDIVDGQPSTHIFTAKVAAMFNIEGSWVYSDESIQKVQPYTYELKAPSMTAKVGTFKTDQVDADGNKFNVYWVETNITKPDFGDAEAIPVSYYLISMDKDKDGNADAYATTLYVYDKAKSLGLNLETGDGIDDNAIITGASTMSLRSTTAAAQLPGTYDFSQTIPSGESMVSFAVDAYDTDNPKEYQYTVEAVYAAGNAEITSVTSATVQTPDDSGTVTGVETVAIDGNASLSVYPVPATVSVTVKASEAIEKVALYSETGAMVKAVEGNGANVMTVPVSGLDEGVYFLRVNALDPVKVIKK